MTDIYYFQELDESLFGWNINREELNISAKFTFHPFNNVLFPIEMTIESFANSQNEEIMVDVSRKNNNIKLRFSAKT